MTDPKEARPRGSSTRATWLLAAVTLVILGSLLMPGPDVPKVEIAHVDLLVHAGLFAAWAGALIAAVPAVRNRPWTAIPAAMAFGLVTETLQLFAQARSFDLLDVVADTFGAAIAAVVASAVARNGTSSEPGVGS
ncbi:MAG: VanZ family protein [Actinomycetota bacterium]|nr:VanZ family protein [Actinomycetota bacterium]